MESQLNVSDLPVCLSGLSWHHIDQCDVISKRQKDVGYQSLLRRRHTVTWSFDFTEDNTLVLPKHQIRPAGSVVIRGGCENLCDLDKIFQPYDVEESDDISFCYALEECLLVGRCRSQLRIMRDRSAEAIMARSALSLYGGSFQCWEKIASVQAVKSLSFSSRKAAALIR